MMDNQLVESSSIASFQLVPKIEANVPLVVADFRLMTVYVSIKENTKMGINRINKTFVRTSAINSNIKDNENIGKTIFFRGDATIESSENIDIAKLGIIISIANTKIAK